MRKKFLIILFIYLTITIQLIPSSICDDIDPNETINVNSEILSASTSLNTEIKIPETNSRACVVIDRKTNTILYGKSENSKRKMA